MRFDFVDMLRNYPKLNAPNLVRSSSSPTRWIRIQPKWEDTDDLREIATAAEAVRSVAPSALLSALRASRSDSWPEDGDTRLVRPEIECRVGRSPPIGRHGSVHRIVVGEWKHSLFLRSQGWTHESKETLTVRCASPVIVQAQALSLK